MLYSPVSREKGVKNITPRANRQTQREEAQGRTRPGPRACDHSREKEGRGVSISEDDRR
jgi:hypothetical protein